MFTVFIARRFDSDHDMVIGLLYTICCTL